MLVMMMIDNFNTQCTMYYFMMMDAEEGLD